MPWNEFYKITKLHSKQDGGGLQQLTFISVENVAFVTFKILNYLLNYLLTQSLIRDIIAMNHIRDNNLFDIQ